jgi:hypothetical protein
MILFSAASYSLVQSVQCSEVKCTVQYSAIHDEILQRSGRCSCSVQCSAVQCSVWFVRGTLYWTLIKGGKVKKGKVYDRNRK